MYRDQSDLDERIRRARIEATLSVDFNEKVMERIASLPKKQRAKSSGASQIRIVGASLMLAGFLLFVLNATPFGKDVYAVTSSITSATSKVGQFHLTLPNMDIMDKINNIKRGIKNER